VIPDYLPDFVVKQASPGARFEAIHRQTSEGVDIYFVANRTPRPARATFALRVVGRLPEVWDAADGSIVAAPSWRAGDRQTRVALELEGHHALFIVFRKPAATTGPGIQPAEGVGRPEPLLALDGPWEISFPAGLGAPENISLPQLTDLSEHAAPGVKYFSGTATYRKQFSLPETQLAASASPVALDLGEVRHVVTVRLNGQELGILWRPPYRVDVTPRLRPGTNRLELDVTNTWANRLVGDQQEPDDCTWYPDQRWGGQNIGAPLRAFPNWFADYVKTGNRPSQGRHTFVFWNKYKKDSPLPPSGLLGPVRLFKSD